MNQDELISELLQALTNDVQKLSQQVDKLPTQSPANYRADIEGLTQTVQELRQQSTKSATAAIDLSAITARFDRIEQQIRQRPEFKMTLYTQIAALSFGLMAILLGVMSYYGWSWKGERDEYQQWYIYDNWRVRYTKQARPEYYNLMEAKLKEPAVYNWIVAQEQADQKRALAQKAAEQAKALSDQANQLEGTTPIKGDKKEGR